MITHEEEITDKKEKKYVLVITPSRIQISALYYVEFKQLSQICISEHKEHSHTKLQQNSSKFQNLCFILELTTYRVLPEGLWSNILSWFPHTGEIKIS